MKYHKALVKRKENNYFECIYVWFDDFLLLTAVCFVNFMYLHNFSAVIMCVHTITIRASESAQNSLPDTVQGDLRDKKRHCSGTKLHQCTMVYSQGPPSWIIMGKESQDCTCYMRAAYTFPWAAEEARLSPFTLWVQLFLLCWLLSLLRNGAISFTKCHD
jgi:hypothetical protein